MTPLIKTAAYAMAIPVLAYSLIVTPAKADSLETMERERAQIVNVILDASLTPEQRERKLIDSKRRLADMERRVLRDDSLVGKNTRAVRQAFDNYDLTFLVHASAENSKTLADQWLDQIGISTHSLMNTTVRRR